MILLDTNVIIDLLRNRRPEVRFRLGAAQASGEALGLSSVSLFELQSGMAGSARREENERAVDGVLSGGIDIVPFDADDARDAGEIRALLRSTGREIGPYDLLIAATARRRGHTLVTHNLKEFRRVPGLVVIDWVD